MTLLDPTPHDHPPHTRPTHTVPPLAGTRTEQEVPEMTLAALLDDAASVDRRTDEIPCQQEDPELWFAESPEDVDFAKSLCGTCPVQRACLVGAVQRREPWGVWGGQLFAGGHIVSRKRPRGRPRKDAAPVEVLGMLERSAS
jgi:WhiB family transcriptional regulator, redox-sensing transcriptional regulator